MQNFDKIYSPLIDVSVNRSQSFKQVKALMFRALPTIFKTCVSGFMLLILQAVAVGTLDRFFGVSPKVSLIFSSLFYVAIFGSLALVGSLKERKTFDIENIASASEPICKILIIKRAGAVEL